MQITGADILVSCLIEQGVDTVFGYPGGAVLYIYDALFKRQDQIRHILTCHEQHAAHAADGYARASGKVGVVIATSGPGATNLVTGIANAYMDSVPMVAITGNVPVSLLGKDSFQEVDIAGITLPITKHNYIVKNVADLAETVRSAFRIASSGRPGPVLIDIPKDVTNTVFDFFPSGGPFGPTPAEPPAEDELEQAVAMIAESKRPMLLIGGGAISANASDQLALFQQKIDAPFTLSLMGTGALPSSHPSFTGMVGMHGSKCSSLAVSQCDLLVAIGSRFSDRVICNPKTFAPDAKILHLDIDPAEINKNIRATHSVSGDVGDILRILNHRLSSSPKPEWQEQVQAWKEKWPPNRPKMQDIFPQKLITTAWEITNGDAIVTTEVGQHQMWAAQFTPVEKPRTFLTSGGLGTMGFGLGAAIGAALASPGKTVINVAGDGSFHMNLMELVTAVELNLPVKILLMNNNVLGMVRQWQRLFYEQRYSHTTLERPTNYEMLAAAFGAKGYTITPDSDMKAVLQEALLSPGPALINCLVGRDVNVVPMVPQGGSIDQQILEISCEEETQ